MDSEIFNKKHKALLFEYDACFEDDCDAWWMISGFIYYKRNGIPFEELPEKVDEKDFIAHITGLRQREGIGLTGNFEKYLEALEKALKENRK
jgi:hypothetical protein